MLDLLDALVKDFADDRTSVDLVIYFSNQGVADSSSCVILLPVGFVQKSPRTSLIVQSVVSKLGTSLMPSEEIY